MITWTGPEAASGDGSIVRYTTKMCGISAEIIVFDGEASMGKGFEGSASCGIECEALPVATIEEAAKLMEDRIMDTMYVFLLEHRPPIIVP